MKRTGGPQPAAAAQCGWYREAGPVASGSNWFSGLVFQFASSERGIRVFSICRARPCEVKASERRTSWHRSGICSAASAVGVPVFHPTSS